MTDRGKASMKQAISNESATSFTLDEKMVLMRAIHPTMPDISVKQDFSVRLEMETGQPGIVPTKRRREK